MRSSSPSILPAVARSPVRCTAFWAAAGLSQSAISRLEAPTGALPTLETMMRYVSACNSHMLFSFSEQEFEERAAESSAEDHKHDVITAVAV